MVKKIGGVKVTLRPVNLPNSEFRIVSGMCVCGKTKQQCNDEWDKRLNIVGHTADSQSGISQYERNRMNIQAAVTEGLDPFCLRAIAAADGYAPHWTPYLPPGSFSVPTTPTLHRGAIHGTDTPKPRGNRRGSGRGNRRS